MFRTTIANSNKASSRISRRLVNHGTERRFLQGSSSGPSWIVQRGGQEGSPKIVATGQRHEQRHYVGASQLSKWTQRPSNMPSIALRGQRQQLQQQPSSFLPANKNGTDAANIPHNMHLLLQSSATTKQPALVQYTTNLHYQQLQAFSHMGPAFPLSQNVMRISRSHAGTAAIRWLGTDTKSNGNPQQPPQESTTTSNSHKDKGDTGTTTSTATTPASGHPGGEPSSSSSPPTQSQSSHHEALDPRTFLIGTTARIRKVADWQVGDEIATYAIAVLLALIVLGPIMAQYMRRSNNTYDEPYTDDQVVDMARILKRDFLDKLSAEEIEAGLGSNNNAQDKGVVNSVIADVLSSKSLQEQAIKFVVTIVSSDEVKAACQRLLQNLWNDLVQDPETTAQVIFLLQAAIQNEDIRLAVKKLVLDIVEDEEVLEELVRLLQKLGQDQDVLDATKTLLTESTHNALNDPEILDHSMEFAADVVGDDVVQRTAGEALRNTLSYAVQPGMSILLAATGVGLLFFSVMSWGYARSSEQDAKVLDQAVSGLARSLQPSPRLADRLWNVISLPFRVISTAAGAVFTTVLLPFHIVQLALARIEYSGRAVNKAVVGATTWLVERCCNAISWIQGEATAISSLVTSTGTAITTFLWTPVSWLDGSKLQRLWEEYWRSLSPDTVAWAWVWMDSVSRFFLACKGYLVSFSMFVTGTSHSSSSSN